MVRCIAAETPLDGPVRWGVVRLGTLLQHGMMCRDCRRRERGDPSNERGPANVLTSGPDGGSLGVGTMTPRGRQRAERLQAVEAVVAEYEGRLLRYAGRVTGRPDSAEDVVQDTFLRLIEKWPGAMVPGPALCSWLYRVAHNCAVDRLRREAHRRDLHERQALDRPESIPADRGAGFRLSEGAELASQVLRTLSLREQQVVILKIYEEKSYREIADITGLTSGNVGYILHHAMKKMARAIQEAKHHD